MHYLFSIAVSRPPSPTDSRRGNCSPCLGRQGSPRFPPCAGNLRLLPYFFSLGPRSRPLIGVSDSEETKNTRHARERDARMVESNPLCLKAMKCCCRSQVCTTSAVPCSTRRIELATLVSCGVPTRPCSWIPAYSLGPPHSPSLFRTGWR